MVKNILGAAALERATWTHPAENGAKGGKIAIGHLETAVVTIRLSNIL
jgi:hypothetical protein